MKIRRFSYSFFSLLCVGLALVPHTACARQAAPAPPVKEETEVVYGTAGSAKLLLDAYTPADTTRKHPAIVLIHGGAWAFGDKKFYTPMCRALAAKGFAAFTINYRLVTTTANKYPRRLMTRSGPCAGYAPTPTSTT